MSGPRRVGDFDLLESLGAGGTGTVWRARHEASGVEVALKTLRGDLGRQGRGLLLREVEAVARLDHAAVVWVHDYDADASTGPWVALELLTGGSLAGAPPARWAELRHLAQSLLQGLAHAHAREVLHRDLKPANVLYGAVTDARPGPKLVDFGVAAVGHGGRSLGATPEFAAPEQLGRGDEGPWTDLFALGTTLWWACTGSTRAREQTFVPRFPVSPDLEEWLRWLTSHRPADRPLRAARALEQLLALRPPPDDARTGPAATWDDAAEPARALATHPRRSPASLRLLALRPPPTVGRSRELGELNRWVARGEPRGCCVAGPEGVGRRHLLRAWTWASRERDLAYPVTIDPSAATPLVDALRGLALPGLGARSEPEAFEALAAFASTADRPVVAVVDAAGGAAGPLVERLVQVRGLRVATWGGSPRAGWHTVEPGPVDPYELGRRLGLKPGLTELLAGVAGGHPGLASEVVRDLARDGQLVPDASGIGLAAGATVGVPAGPRARAEAQVASLPPSLAAQAAAVLGPMPAEVWADVLDLLSSEGSVADLAAWSRAGVVRLGAGAPTFDDPACRAVVAEAVSSELRRRIFDAGAAAVLERPELSAEYAEWTCRAGRPDQALLFEAATRCLTARREVSFRLLDLAMDAARARGLSVDELIAARSSLLLNAGDGRGALADLDALPRPLSQYAQLQRAKVAWRLGLATAAREALRGLPTPAGRGHWLLCAELAVAAGDLDEAERFVHHADPDERPGVLIQLALVRRDPTVLRRVVAQVRLDREQELWARLYTAVGGALGMVPEPSLEALEQAALEALARPYPYVHSLLAACLLAWAVRHEPAEVSRRLAACAESSAIHGARLWVVREIVLAVAGAAGAHESALRAFADTQALA